MSLGSTPLANALLTKEQLGIQETSYPLDLVFCNSCSLVQITETVSPSELFAEYLYFSSVLDTMVKHSAQRVHQVINDRHLDGGSLAVEIASNDGYLLQSYKEKGVPTLGIEPAANIAAVAEE